MSIDSQQKRMSAMNPRCPWRGPRVDATETGFNEGNRRSALFSYSLIDVSVAADRDRRNRNRRRHKNIHRLHR